MIVFAIATWAAYTTLLMMTLVQGLKHRRLSLIAFATVLTIVTSLRQVLYFWGLATPFPENYFMKTEWALIGAANLVLITWLVVTMLSYSFNAPLARLVSPLFPSRDPSPDPKSPPRGVLLAILPPFLVAVGGTAWLIASFGGVANFTFAVKVSKSLTGSYAIRTLGVIACMLSYYAFISSIKFSATGRIQLPRMTLIYLAMVIMTLAANFAWGNRYALALIFLGYMLAWHLYIRKIKPMTFLLVGASAATLLQGLKLLRLALVSEATGNEIVANTDFWLNLSTSLHLVEFDALLLALRDSGVLFEFRWAQDFINGLLSWVPRSLYPDKETFHIGGWFRQIYQPWTVNGWPVTTPGSWYVNFSVWGIPIGGWISGLLMRAFDTAFDKLENSAWKCSIGPVLVFFMFEGGISMGFPQYVFLYLVPLFLAQIWVAQVSRSK